MAKAGFIVTGVILLVIAGSSYVTLVTDTGYTIHGVVNLCNTDLAQLGQLFSGDLQQTCGQYQLLQFGVIGFAVIGIILIIVGAVVPSGNPRNVKPLTCPFCNYSASSVHELHNHSLNCEKRNQVAQVRNEALHILKERYAKGKKIVQLFLLGLLIAFFGFLAVMLILTGKGSSVEGGLVFLIPTGIFVVCFIAILYDKG